MEGERETVGRVRKRESFIYYVTDTDLSVKAGAAFNNENLYTSFVY